MKSINVDLKERAYPIFLGQNIRKSISDIMTKFNVSKNVVIISHDNLIELYGNEIKNILETSGFNVLILTVPQGESSKSWDFVKYLLDELLKNRFERKDSVIALGGGVIGDLAGFVASIYLRGINLFQMPTSLLAQVDSSIGGKTGIDHEMGKNLIGSFYQPRAIIMDVSVLATLPKREILCGLAEIVKYGVIKNLDLYEFIVEHLDTINRLNINQDLDIWEYLIESSAKDKAFVVANDEKESGLREILNFGHTIGHGIEASYKYSDILHGEAVALGMKAAMWISVQMNMCSKNVYDNFLNLLEKLGFKLTLEKLDVELIFSKMFSDKKVRDGKLRFVLVNDLSKVSVQDNVSLDLVKDAINQLNEVA